MPTSPSGSVCGSCCGLAAIAVKKRLQDIAKKKRDRVSCIVEAR